MTLKKLYDVKEVNGKNYVYDFYLLARIVAGASLMSMKTADWN